MSRIEEAVKPAIENGMFDRDVTFNHEEQIQLGLWAVLKAMVYDSQTLPKLVVPSEERKSVFEGNLPLERWQAWIGRTAVPPGLNAPAQTKLTLLMDDESKTNPYGPALANSFTTTFAMGALLVHSFYSKGAAGNAEVGFGGVFSGRLLRIWPLPERDSLHWRSLRPLSIPSIQELNRSIGVARAGRPPPH